MNIFDKLEMIWSVFVKDDLLLEVDQKSQELIRELKPDFLLCDQIWCMASTILFVGCSLT